MLISVAATSCSDNEPDLSISGVDCDRLSNSFIDEDYTYAAPIIDSICLTLPASPTSSDPLGHEINSNTLIQKLNANCDDLTFSLICYACLESFPLQSSILVTKESVDGQISRNFALTVPENEFMYFSN